MADKSKTFEQYLREALKREKRDIQKRAWVPDRVKRSFDPKEQQGK